MCECYQVGGRFIAEDPDCPVHGREAQRREARQEEERYTMDERISALEAVVYRQAILISELIERLDHIDGGKKK